MEKDKQFVMVFNWLGAGDYNWGIRQPNGKYKFNYEDGSSDEWTEDGIKNEQFVTSIFFDEHQLVGMYRDLK